MLTSLSMVHLSAADGEAVTAPESLWVTSIAQIGSSDQFAAATADGLLLREAAVYSFPGSDPTDRTKLYSHPAAVWSVVSSRDGGRIASVDYRGNLVVFDTASSEPTLHEKALESWCQAIILGPDDNSLIAGNEAGKVFVWDLSAAKISKSVELDGHAVTGLAISPDGSQLAASDGGGHVHLLKWPELEPLGKIDISDDSAWCVAYIDQGSELLVGSGNRRLYRCAAKPDAKPEVVATGTDWVTELAVSPSGQIAAAEIGGRLHFPSTGGTDSMYAKSGVWALCWNGEGQLFAGTRKDGIVIAGRSWKWTEPKPAVAETAKAEESKELEQESSEATEKPAAQPADEKSADEKPAEDKPSKPADENGKPE
jgi:WD40 repeat protein